LFWKNKNRNELIACGSGFVRSYDPKTGDELWNMDDVGMSFSASPAADDQKIYFGNSGPRSNGPLVAVNDSMAGTNAFSPDLETEGLEWIVMQAGPGLASPVAVNGNVYIPSREKLTCYSTTDGSVSFKERMKLGSMAASLWAAGDRIFMMQEKQLFSKPVTA
jgi:outer membrane protein assembly factor BamB